MIGFNYGYGMYILNPYIYGSAPSFTNTKSLLLDGVDELVTTSNIASIQGASNASFSFWIKVVDGSATEYVTGRLINSTDHCYLAKSVSYLQWDIANPSSTKSYQRSAAGISSGVWTHICLVYDGSLTNANRCKIYINGSHSVGGTNGTVPTTLPNTSDSFGIASLTTSLNVNGNIDEYSIFDYSLTSTQVTSIYNSGTPTDLDNTSGVTAPVHWWRMGDGDTFPTITDVGTTGGNDGTMTNMESGDIVTDTP